MKIETSGYGPVTLGGLIHAVERRQLGEDGKPRYMRFDFGSLVPTSLDSYRGYYSELAIGFASPDEAEPNASTFLSMLKGAVGSTYTGWKGGDYKMDENTAIFVANRGNATQCGISGIYVNDGYQIVLLTDYFG
jgi:hypothetical protein